LLGKDILAEQGEDPEFTKLEDPPAEIKKIVETKPILPLTVKPLTVASKPVITGAKPEAPKSMTLAELEALNKKT